MVGLKALFVNDPCGHRAKIIMRRKVSFFALVNHPLFYLLDLWQNKQN